jgi:transcription elongation factor GreB
VFEYMSKAFMRESDHDSELPPLARQPSALPFGAKNYMTSGGIQRLREELDRLLNSERYRTAALGNDEDAKRQRRLLDARIFQLQRSLELAVVVPRLTTPEDRVRFGATVTVRDGSGIQSQYRIVGVDETDIDHGWVSWLSPIAKALLNKRLGERVRFKFPSGEEELEIIRLAYE